MDEGEELRIPGRWRRLADHPLTEAGLVLGVFWLGAYLPLRGLAAPVRLEDPAYHLALALSLIPKALLVLLLMDRRAGLGTFGGLVRPRPAHLGGALLVALGALGLVLLPSAVLAFLHAAGLGDLPVNPLLAAVGRPSARAYLLVPAVLASCLGVGYTEELCFRIYLPHRLAEAGLPRDWAAAVAVLLFAGAHGAQGLLGMGLAALLGAWFAGRRRSGATLHELALGHALYDTAVILAVLYLKP